MGLVGPATSRARALTLAHGSGVGSQFIRYLAVGGLSALVDVGTLVSCTEIAGLPYLLSAAVAFLLGTVVNYLLSVLWVFRSSGRIPTEFVLFTLVGLGGLGLTELILWLLVEIVGLHYLQAKAVALGVVLVWSFTLRRLLFARLASARDGAPGR